MADDFMNRQKQGPVLRAYIPSDCRHLAELFYETVHSVNARDYTQKQLDAWATGRVDLEEWNRSFLEHHTVVAVMDMSICMEDTINDTTNDTIDASDYAGERCPDSLIVGFGDIDRTGYLDRLYVHKDYQGQGIAAAICDELERTVEGKRITVHASITAKPFFQARGYRIVKEQQVVRRGILLTNYVMEKL